MVLSWPDAVLSVAQVGFIIALIPTVLGPNKPAKLTAGITALLVYACAVALAGLGVYVSACLNMICGILWTVIFFQAKR